MKCSSLTAEGAFQREPNVLEGFQNVAFSKHNLMLFVISWGCVRVLDCLIFLTFDFVLLSLSL